MTRRRNRLPPPAAPLDPKARRRRVKLWCFRLGAAVLVPLVFLLVLEVVLRLFGFGHPTSFLLPAEQGGKKVFVQNNRFGWRFFGSEQSPQPACFAIPRKKPKDTVRVFVLGESVAFGDPQPDFGLPRMIQALLSERFPGTRFEVVNASMVGINSHALLPIARDCAGAGGDIWVIYMGNNEVVGPFGAGTVFGPQAPGLALVRGSLALKATRTGQLFERGIRQIRKPPADKSEWGGMMMFLKNRVRLDDPKLASTYQHFERNLADMLDAGKRAGVGVVLSTVAVNLKDCAPFASSHRPTLNDTDKAQWEMLFQRGIDAQQAGRLRESSSIFRAAAELDDTSAELQFRLGMVALAQGDQAEAERHFAAARDLDTLRFRCDRRLNEITRRLAAERASAGVLFTDAEDALARQSPKGIPGSELFYEHVHLTFEGNYQLAWNLVREIEKLLPDAVRARAEAAKPWASAEECARRLAWTDASRLAAVSDMLGRFQDPPFTWQFDHSDQMRRLTQQIERLRPGARAASRRGEAIFREALGLAPDDPALHAQRAASLAGGGDAKGALESARRAVELLPHHAEYWGQLGDVQAQLQQFAEAAAAYQEALRHDPGNFWALHNLARTRAKLGQQAEALRDYREAIRIQPRFGPAHLGLGQLLEAAGNKAEAEEHFRKALTHRVRRAAELTALARFCHQRGWHEAAVTNYIDALKLNPTEAPLHLAAGQCLAALGRPAEADRHFAEAVRLAPDAGETRFLLGLELGRLGKPAEAVVHFREAVRLLPNLIEARLNLGVALMNIEKNLEALEQFEEVLRRSPTNTTALLHAETLRARTGPIPPK